jgi:sulfite exporter TauE/SafE
MLASISPVGEASRHQRWTLTVVAYLLASTAGGLAVGAAVGAVGAGVSVVTGRPSSGAVLLVLGVLGLLTAAIDLRTPAMPLPSWQRQVDERWLTTYRGWVYGAGFGAQLGGAVFTRIPTATTYLWLAAAAATFSPMLGGLIGAAFGAVRAAPLLLTRALRDPARLQRFHARMEERSPTARRGASVAVVLTVAATLVVAG